MRLGQVLHPMRGVLNELFQSIYKVREVDLTDLQAAVQEDFAALAIDRQHRTARAAPEQVRFQQVLKHDLTSFGPNDAHGAVEEHEATFIGRRFNATRPSKMSWQARLSSSRRSGNPIRAPSCDRMSSIVMADPLRVLALSGLDVRPIAPTRR